LTAHFQNKIKSLLLFPYTLFPIDDGAKRESWKILSVLKELGDCTVFSALKKPVGRGWTSHARHEMDRQNIHVVFREQLQKRRNLLQLTGIIYAACCKGLKLEKAFGHSNPYHRWAFPRVVWNKLVDQFNLAVISYSYWAWLPTRCSKVVVLHDLLSGYMWEKSKRETRDLKTADLVIVISKAEEEKLHERGITNTHWSPPAVNRIDAPLNENVGIVGSDNPFNREGLEWLKSVGPNLKIPVRVYGGISKRKLGENFNSMGSYDDIWTPYRECGVLLIPTAMGMGVQIKAVEALAAGRAIIARAGAMRGIPHSNQAWVEVDDPQEMLEAADRLSRDQKRRKEMGEAAHAYYEKYLNAGNIHRNLLSAIQNVARS